MKKGKKVTALLAIWVIFLNPLAIAQTDSLDLKNPEITNSEQPTLHLETETKRQRNKTERKVFVACLFIVLTTILLYNVRSK
ncbi:MAG TPA: hypothetical protein VK927_11320 [Adhaeribacter sp.]|nr:hypothetical protein [Adhaeribacter sp.]